MLALAKARTPRGPKLSFTSAKTGVGVLEAFAYAARRVVMRWEWEEEAVYVDVPDFDGGNSTVHLGDAMTRSFRPACCSSRGQEKDSDIIFILSTVPTSTVVISIHEPGITPLYIQGGVQNDYRTAAVFITVFIT
jgi:hypothetical protein